MQPFDPISFKFRWVDDAGVTTGLFSSLGGSFDGEVLHLHTTEIVADSITSISSQEHYISIAAESREEGPYHITFALYGTEPKPLIKAINASRSDVLAIANQQELEAAGQGESYRQQICTHCAATVTLSFLPITPQCYCEYCETLFTVNMREHVRVLPGEAPIGMTSQQESEHKICDECGMYSHPRKFTIFYFYFLLYFMGWSSDKTFRCPGCMRWEAWKMFAVNIFGLLGLPVAITQLIRSYRSKTSKGPLSGLDDANILARKGKIDRALDRYDKLMDNVPINAGIKYNIAQGLMRKEDFASAKAMYTMSLEDCANYWPSVAGLANCLAHLEQLDEMEALRARYSEYGAAWAEMDSLEMLNELDVIESEMWGELEE